MNADTIDTTKLWDLIKDIRFAMFTARHGDGQLHSRPMTTQNGSSERGGVLWFFMSRSGQPVADLEEHPEVNVTYSDPGKDSYVSISGAARVVEDFERKKAMWNTAAQAWFPGGPTDPDLALVAVLVAEAEYWDVKSNQAVQIFKMAKAAVTGARPRTWSSTAARGCRDQRLGVVAAPTPAPTAPPTSRPGTTPSGVRAPIRAPDPAPMPPPVTARWPQVSPHAAVPSRTAARTRYFAM